jgi:hypothetical protein
LNWLKFIADCFVVALATKQFSCSTKPFPAFAQISGNSRWLSIATQAADSEQRRAGESQMRTLSFILAFALVLAGPSMVSSSDGGLPGAGTFAYTGSPIAASVPQSIVVAAN